MKRGKTSLFLYGNFPIIGKCHRTRICYIQYRNFLQLLCNNFILSLQDILTESYKTNSREYLRSGTVNKKSAQIVPNAEEYANKGKFVRGFSHSTKLD